MLLSEDGASSVAPQTDPSSSSDGQSHQESAKAPSKLPKSLEGKSPEQIAEMYVHAEKKIGQQSEELGESRKIRENLNVLLMALKKDPQLYKQVDKAVKKLQGYEDESSEDPEGDEKDLSHKKTGNDDIRLEAQTRIISDFEKSFGLDKLSKDKRKTLNDEIGTELAELFDPSGEKTVGQVIREIPVSKLSKYLEKAYKLARPKVFTDDETYDEDDFSSIGGFSAGSSKSRSNHGLTADEARIAEKLGIEPAKYAKQKQDMNKK